MTKKRLSELNKIVEQIPLDKQTVAKNLVEEIVFLYDTMTDLKKQIKEHGTVELFSQGKQQFLRESPALKSYNVSVNRYKALYKQLVDMMPKTAPEPENELLAFMESA